MAHRKRLPWVLVPLILAAGCGGNDNGTAPRKPTVAITFPAHGATVSGTVVVTANAQHADSVLFTVEGVEVVLDRTDPFSWSWNTAGYSDGAHTLGAVAAGAGGTASDEISVTVQNVGGSGISAESKQAVAQTFHTGTNTGILAADLIDGAVQAVFTASLLATGGTQIVTTGTLTQNPQDPEVFAYSPTPADRMIILLIGAPAIDVVYAAFSGYLGGSWEDFRDFHDNLDFQVDVTGTVSLHVHSASGNPGKPAPAAAPASNTAHQRTLSGTVVDQGVNVTVNVTTQGTRFFSVDLSSVELETSDQVTGTLSSALGSTTVNDAWQYHSIGVSDFVEQFARTNASTLTQGGSTWQFVDVLLRGVYKNVLVSEPDYWRGEGVLLRDGVVVGQVAWDRPIVDGTPEPLFPKAVLVLTGGEVVPLAPSPAAELAKAWAAPGHSPRP